MANLKHIFNVVLFVQWLVILSNFYVFTVNCTSPIEKCLFESFAQVWVFWSSFCCSNLCLQLCSSEHSQIDSLRGVWYPAEILKMAQERSEKWLRLQSTCMSCKYKDLSCQAKCCCDKNLDSPSWGDGDSPDLLCRWLTRTSECQVQREILREPEEDTWCHPLTCTSRHTFTCASAHEARAIHGKCFLASAIEW